MSVNLYTSSIYLRSIFIIALNDIFALWEFSFAFGNMRGVSSHPPSLGHLTVTVVSTVFHPSSCLLIIYYREWSIKINMHQVNRKACIVLRYGAFAFLIAFLILLLVLLY